MGRRCGQHESSVIQQGWNEPLAPLTPRGSSSVASAAGTAPSIEIAGASALTTSSVAAPETNGVPSPYASKG